VLELRMPYSRTREAIIHRKAGLRGSGNNSPVISDGSGLRELSANCCLIQVRVLTDRSKNQRSFWIVRWLGAIMFYPTLPFTAQKVKTETVLLWVCC